MTTVAIVGGKLQGTEAVYLARKAGMMSLLIDKDPKAPASGFCDEMHALDVRKKTPQLMDVYKKADFILPALENDEAHAAIIGMAEEYGFRVAFDARAYSITSSKLKSDAMMKEYAIPAPRYYPECGGPYILKPSGDSGSAGVLRVESEAEVRRFLSETKNPENWVVQEYLEGPSYSIEIVGTPGAYRTYEITGIHMADDYDCNMVTAPCRLAEGNDDKFSEIAGALASMVGLSGIMDVEVIEHKGELKVLEIDARLPSQTPIVVYKRSGVNLLSELADITIDGKFNNKIQKGRIYAAIEHYLIDGNGIHNRGEHIMTEGRPLIYKENFFGADEAITDYDGGRLPWRGMFINSAETGEALEKKRSAMKKNLLSERAK